MGQGGKRVNSGRKKIGKVLNTRIDSYTLKYIDSNFIGNTRAERIRECLNSGIITQQNGEISYSFQTIKLFAKSHTKISNIIRLNCPNISEIEVIKIINKIILSCFYNIDFNNNKVNQSKIEKYISSIKKIVVLPQEKNIIIANELDRYHWNLKNNIHRKNEISLKTIGYFFEQLINQKQTGAYYTAEDVTSYMCLNPLILSILEDVNYSFNLKNDLLLAYNSYPQPYSSSDNNQVYDFPELISKNINIVQLLSDVVSNKNCKYNYREDIFFAIKRMTILDPTVGTGAFIIAAINLLLVIFEKLNFSLYIDRKSYIIYLLKNCLYGLDIMDTAIEILKLRISLFLRLNGFNENEILNISLNMYCGNFLLDPREYSYEINEKKNDEFMIRNKAFDIRDKFSTVFKNRGFSIIIGNPPYIESKNNSFSVNGMLFETLKCGNIYAYVFERGISILKPNGYISFIVPISIISTLRMNSLREYIYRNTDLTYFINFADRPSSLFVGVHQKVSIVFCRKSDNPCRIFSSAYYHWNKFERDNLMDNLSMFETTYNKNPYFKIGCKIQNDIVNIFSNGKNCISRYFSKKTTDFPIYLNMRATFWCKCFLESQKSKEYKVFYVNSSIDQIMLFTFFNSSTFFMLWESISDCWHITNILFDKIYIELDKISEQSKLQLIQLSERLRKDMEKNKVYIGSVQTEYEYRHKKSKKIIDEIDYEYAKNFNLSKEQLSYILNYCIKYRMNDEYMNYLKEN